jgi:hypothetical protein
MQSVEILKVGIYEGKVSVFPAESNNWYEYIYREAAGIYWNKDLSCFQAGENLGEWGFQQWFLQIINIAKSGLGVDLWLSDATIYDSNLENFEDKIKSTFNRRSG